MSSVPRGVPPVASWLVAAALVACTHADTPTVHADTPSATAPPRAPSGAEPPAPPEPPPDPVALATAKAWTDPAVVGALAHDCGYEPARADQWNGPGPMSCDLDVEQSCVPDPCFDADQRECKPACKKGCDECAGGCKAGCQQCKSACRDDACRRACAATCAECRQGCLRDKDHCSSGTCSAAYDACTKQLAAEWKSSTCPRVCPAAVHCAERCWASANDSENCVKSCKERLMKGCPERFFGMCLFGVTPGG